MKKNIIIGGAVAIVVIFLCICCMICVLYPRCTDKLSFNSNETNETYLTQNVISVQGKSSIVVTPTIAYVDIGVTTFNENALDAQRENADKMTRVYEALDGIGIEKDKIKTVNYSISPRYEYTYYKSEMTGYDVSNRIMITVMDISKVSQILDMTAQQGVNDANSVSFGISDDEKNTIYNQALAKAVAIAKGKAEAIETASDTTLVGPVSITEGSPVYSVNYGYSSAEIAKDQASTPISGGELTVEASVTIIYAYIYND